MRFTFLLILLSSLNVFAVKIKGIIKDTAGEPLGFASVVVRGETTGTMANAQGEFVLDLPGNKSYDLVFQFMGYKSVSRSIDLKQEDITLQIVLQEQAINLGEIKIGKSKEDPAYSIMRKAIAKSKIHDKQVLAYDADAYIKNTVLFNKIPLLLKKEIEKDGFKVGVPSITEMVMNIKFSQPNKRVIKVLAKKQSLNSIDIEGYILLNFYNIPTNMGMISPLSPNAFSYYKFEYLGYFEDRGQVVNKIKVIPKSYGPGVFKGTIFILEDYWSIHSLDLETISQGVSFKTKQLYSPTKNVWVPTSQVLDVNGKLLGFDFTFKGQVSPKYKSISLNSKFIEEVKVIDDKGLPKRKQEPKTLGQNELTIKEMNRMIKQMEKEEKKVAKTQEKNVVREDSVSYDSLVNKRSQEYWETVRSIPLTAEETKGYTFGDSIKIVKQNDTTKKILKPKSPLFKALWGGSYLLSKQDSSKTTLEYSSPLIPFMGVHYNIVEGVFTQTQFNFQKKPSFQHYNGWHYSINNTLKYAFGIERFMAKTDIKFTKGENTFEAGGGSFNQTFDRNQNIPLYANTIVNLFKINLTQMYMNEGGYIGYNYKKDNLFSFSTNLEYAQRSMMYNLTNIKLGIGNREPTPNSPTNLELNPSDFPKHNALLWSSMLTYSPGAKYRLFNGKKIYTESNKPEFNLRYTKGMADVNYDVISLGINQKINTGPKSQFKYYIEGGDFLNSSKVYLMDMKHVNSVNFLNAASGSVFAFYRLLNTNLPLQISPDNYYKYSTQGAYLKGHAVNEFRKLLFTQIPIVRYTGIKEDLFINYLKTPAKTNYLEVGYGINGLLKVLRFEVITAFEQGQKPRFGWQIGAAF